MRADDERLRWLKAQQCESSGCVEVATGDGMVFVRNSRDPDGDWLSFTRREWLDFVDGVRSGRFVVD